MVSPTFMEIIKTHEKDSIFDMRTKLVKYLDEFERMKSIIRDNAYNDIINNNIPPPYNDREPHSLPPSLPPRYSSPHSPPSAFEPGSVDEDGLPLRTSSEHFDDPNEVWPNNNNRTTPNDDRRVEGGKRKRRKTRKYKRKTRKSKKSIRKTTRRR